MIFNLILLLFSCNKSKELERPPDKFIGKWVQYGKPFYHEVPARIEISDKLVVYEPLHFEGDEVSINYLPIVKINKAGDEVIIFCGEQNQDHWANRRFILDYNPNNTISVSEIVPTGINQNTETFFIGTFKMTDI